MNILKFDFFISVVSFELSDCLESLKGTETFASWFCLPGLVDILQDHDSVDFFSFEAYCVLLHGNAINLDGLKTYIKVLDV